MERGAGASPELTDVLAYLARRSDNAATMARHSAEHAELARERQRQLEVISDELRAGLHHGAALMRVDQLEARLAVTAKPAGMERSDISAGEPTPPQADGK